MAKDPAFLFYSSDFITGTLIMTFEDRGKYITILAYMHQNGRLSEETIRLLVGNVSDMLRLKFSIDKKGLWFNERLEIEVEKRRNFIESRHENGKKGGRPPKEKPLEEKPLGKPTDNLIEDVNDNTIGDKKGSKNYSDSDPEKLELEKAIALQFGLNEIAHFRQISTIKAFVNVTSEKFGFQHVVKTITDYLIYKEKSGSIKFQFKNFIGTPEESFSDGGWNSNNWEHLMKNNNGTKQSTPDAKKASRDAVATELREMRARNNGQVI